MANILGLSLNAIIQILDTSLQGNPAIYSRNPIFPVAPQLNMLEQVLNLTTSTAIPLSGSSAYSLFYARNLLPINSQLVLNVDVTIGGQTTAFQLCAQAYILLGSPGTTHAASIRIDGVTLSSFSGQFPILCEYAVASVEAI